MSKVFVKIKVNSYVYEGQAIKQDNTIKFYDQNVLTIIKLGNIIEIERKTDYYLKLKFKKGIKLAGEYKTKYGPIKIETFTKKLIQDNFSFNIEYDLYINDTFSETFTYIFKYSIDTY